MSVASNRSATGLHRRIESVQRQNGAARSASRVASRRVVDRYDAYTFTLRVAYLAHLLDPRSRRTQHLAAPARPTPQRHSSSVADLVKDFSHIRDSKSTRLPKDFFPDLDKRITNVLMGKEKSPEYGDPLVKRTFAVFLNEFKRPEFRKSVEKDRRVEDLILIFFSNATKEMQSGKQAGDDGWKLIVDRHVALFVRLISSALKSNNWSRDRPELSARLTTLESKLLRHDQDLSSPANSNGAGGTAQTSEAPKSMDVKDMPMVQSVAFVFGKTLDQAQNEINEQKDLWTEKAALQDLKMYQANLSLNNRRTLRNEDFDTEGAYEAWKKAELPELSHMIHAILQSKIELARSAPGAIPQFKPTSNDVPSTSPTRSFPDSDGSSYVFDQPVDVSGLSLNHKSDGIDDGEPYMFIPPDPRDYYRAVVKEAFLRDSQDQALEPMGNGSSAKLFSKRSTDLLSELGMRWRIPFISRLLIFMDVVRELFQDQALELDTLDAAFLYVKEPVMEKKKTDLAALYDRSKWPTADYILSQQIVNSLNDTLLRDLFERICGSYGAKMPDVGSIMTILETHIYDDPLFSRTPEDLDRYSAQLDVALRDKAMEQFQQIYAKEVQQHGDQTEFYHIIQLGKGVLKLADRIQKRFRKIPEIMGVAPFRILVQTIFPALGSDLRELLERVMARAEQTGEEIPVQDGFDVYKEMVEIRTIYTQAVPDTPFPFHVEAMLSTFVWRWVEMTAASIPVWVENAVQQDNFAVKQANGEQPVSTSDYHSSSVIDIFRSFNQGTEQIVSLNWDDDYQYAKFMTAISKSVGIGIERFCELLEAMFVKEMDRLTPTQEAQQQETRQEKWMRLAKDAISTKEKVEPFQFLPESFVKLNDIEYAMHHLDRLQSDINVDACAEVISRNEPQSQSKRKAQKYVFTIKIIEAEDLRACDANGLSDPYVVLGDEKQRRLAKTRIIYSNLNPRWDETFDITASGLLNVTATIWDWDTLGDHDCVGRTTIKLDPGHFSDFLPREYWLDLDTQGRLLVRVSMEGEKDDIQFYFGKAFRNLKRTERDMTRKITDKLSAYIHHCLSRRALRTMTRQNLSISSVSSSVSSMLASRNLSSFAAMSRQPAAPTGPSQAEVTAALQPLFTYLNENFAIMQQTLTPTSMITVMTRVWKEVLSTIESLLVPPLSDKPSAQRQLSESELDTVFKWLRMLFDFFHAVDDETKVANGVPIDILKNPKYHDLQNLNFFYYESTETLIRTSERMAVATADRRRQQEQQSSAGATVAPPASSAAGPAGLLNMPTAGSRSKSIYVSRNLGTMRKAKEAKRRDAQAEPSDDMILRILRMRPEAAKYLRDRARQKERMAAAAAAEFIVKQSLAQGARRAARREGM